MTTMQADAFTNRLSDYLDDEDLDPSERAAIEGHLAGCAGCRRTLAELRDVTIRARALEDAPPAADLWPGVASRLSRPDRVVPFPSRPPRLFSFTLSQLVAAGLALMVLSGGLVWMARIGGARTDMQPVLGAPSAASQPAAAQTEVTPANFADAQYDQAVADLERALDLGRGRLDPETVRILEVNLQAIDRAIEQSRRALSEDPANMYLNAHLAQYRQRKLALLRRATAIASNES
jgi:tetratricopeptide (TPR) repeat protein